VEPRGGARQLPLVAAERGGPCEGRAFMPRAPVGSPSLMATEVGRLPTGRLVDALMGRSRGLGVGSRYTARTPVAPAGGLAGSY